MYSYFSQEGATADLTSHISSDHYGLSNIIAKNQNGSIQRGNEIPMEYAHELSFIKTLSSEYFIGNAQKPRSRLRISVSPPMLM